MNNSIDIVLTIIEKYATSIEKVKKTDVLKEIGIDSLKTVEMIIELENRLNIQFSINNLDLDSLVNVNDICKLVENYL